MPPAADPSSEPLKASHPLRRLLPLVHEHSLAFWGGMALICVGRIFEAGVPLMFKLSINRLAASDNRLTLPVLVILCLAVLRYFSVAWGRKFVRQVGVTVTYDLRECLYWHFQLQGPRFFARYPTGDLMARAINDLNLVRQMV